MKEYTKHQHRRHAKIQKKLLPIIQNDELQRPSKHGFSPLSVLRKMHRYPISFLAMLESGALSGSQSLEVFCPGYGSRKDSDFDVYQLADPHAIIDVMHALRFAPVRWNNFITTYLTQFTKCGLAIVPHLLFLDLVEKMDTPPDVLHAFFRSRYGNPKYFDFFDRFTAAYEACKRKWELLHQKDFTGNGLLLNKVLAMGFKTKIENSVWLFEAASDQFHDVPGSIATLLEDGDVATLRKALRTAVTDWENMGWPKMLLAGYIKSRLMSSESNVGDVASRMLRIFGRADTTDEFGDIYHGRTPDMQAEEDEFHILRGTVKKDTKIQLMLVPSRNHSVFHTILGFYATHPMSLITCTYGAHLYYDSAEDHISHEIDVNDISWKQRGAPKAKEKYQERGWTFKSLHEGRKLRSGASEGVARADYEYIYKSAMKKGQALPLWWDAYFSTRREALETSSWIENKGKISHTTYHQEFLSRDGGLLQWVQENSASRDVIPKHLWKKRENIAWTPLDLWFGGAKLLAIAVMETQKHTEELLASQKRDRADRTDD